MSQFHVNQIETFIRDKFGSSNWNSTLSDVANLSRILSLHAAHFVLGTVEPDQRDLEITDGGQDRGIDAVAVDYAEKVVVLVQSKWRQDGTGSLRLDEILKLTDGVRSLIGMKSTHALVHASPNMRRAVSEILRKPGGTIRLVTVTTANDPLSAEVRQPIEELLAALNDVTGVEPIAQYTHLGQGELFNGLAPVPRSFVNFDVQLMDWGRTTDPYKMFYGRVAAADIAKLYQVHGALLFSQNIRVVIPRSDINDGIFSTLESEPRLLGYYNNGVTILAESIQIGASGVLNRDVGYLQLRNASIVNGAQTVSTLGRALGSDTESNLTDAFVLVRCIEVPNTAPELGRRITRFANTQNEVSTQDFASLDPQQHRLARELRVLGYEYLLRPGEVQTISTATVIDVRQAAVALACACPTVVEAVIAKREVSRLFSEQRTYNSLFNASTDPLQLVRSFLVVSEVDRILDEVENNSDGIEAGVAVHGRRVIAHLVLKPISASLRNPRMDFNEFLGSVDSETRRFLSGIVAAFPERTYPGNLFKNLGRTQQLLDEANL